MRFAYSATFAAVFILTSSSAMGQNLSLTNFQLSTEQQVNRMQWRVSYRADLVNNGSALSSASATVTSQMPNVVVVQGQDGLNFAAVPANGTATSSNTFTILVDRTIALDLTQLLWNIQSSVGPIAKPGADQLVALGATVTLNGSASTNPSGTGTLTYSWSFTSRPAGSTASFSAPTSATTTFAPDRAGIYQVTLTVSNGTASNSAPVKVTADTLPVANAGADQSALVGAVVQLSGAGSSDADGDSLTYAWTLTTRPAGSSAQLANASTVSPTLTPDVAGTYVAQLIVNDSKFSSTPSTVTITAGASGGAITINSTSVGQNLQRQLGILISPAAPAGGLPVTLTSGDSAKLLVSGRLVDPGSSSIVLTIPEGTSVISAIIQGVAGSGSATLTASAPGYASKSATIVLSPSGFVLSGPGGLGTSGFTTNVGQKTGLVVNSAMLDSAKNFVETQQLRAGFSTSISIAVDVSTIGFISPASIALGGGSESAAAQFTAQSSGSAALTLSVPASFNRTNQYQSLTAVVSVPSLALSQSDFTVGQNLQTDGHVQLNGVAPSGGLDIVISSNDSAKLLLSNTPTGAGTASITVNIPAGFSASQSYYLQVLGNSGQASYMATASGFGNSTNSLTLGPSGVIIAGPNGIGATSFSTTSGAANSDIGVYSALLTSSLAFSAIQPIRGGLSISVPVTSSATSVGTISTSPVTIGSGSSFANTQFHPISSGNATLSVGTPSGFSTPSQFTSVSANVLTPGLGITNDLTIGQNLQEQGSLTLGKPAPSGGVQVTLIAADPSQLLLSTSPTVAGSASIVLTIPVGESNAIYYLQALGNNGMVSYSASASGYSSRTASSIGLAPSGVALAGPVGFGLPFFYSNLSSGSTSPLTVYTMQLDPSSNNRGTVQPLRGGFQISANLTNSNSAVGSVSPLQVTIGSGSDHADVTFKPLTVGNTTITLIKPSGFGLAANAYTLAATVSQ